MEVTKLATAAKKVLIARITIAQRLHNPLHTSRRHVDYYEAKMLYWNKPRNKVTLAAINRKLPTD